MMMNEISGKELAVKLANKEDIKIIDVREPFELAEGKIPEVKNIPIGDIPGRFPELNINKHYYIICLTGARSGSTCAFLAERGYQTTNVTGGMALWPGEIER